MATATCSSKHMTHSDWVVWLAAPGERDDTSCPGESNEVQGWLGGVWNCVLGWGFWIFEAKSLKVSENHSSVALQGFLFPKPSLGAGAILCIHPLGVSSRAETFGGGRGGGVGTKRRRRVSKSCWGGGGEKMKLLKKPHGQELARKGTHTRSFAQGHLLHSKNPKPTAPCGSLAAVATATATEAAAGF